MAAGLPVDKWFAFLLIVMNSTVLPPAMLGTGPDPSKKIFSSDKVSAFSKQQCFSEESDSLKAADRILDRWAEEMQGVLVRARST